MVMEIIEEGNKIYECKCCGCKFKITSEKEVDRFDHMVVDVGAFLPHYERWYCHTVKCPQCGEKIVIKWIR